MKAIIGGYEFTHILNTKRGAVTHLLVENDVVIKVQNNTGMITAIEGMKLLEAQRHVRDVLKYKSMIIAI
jgi:hypothetical protein